MKYFETPWNRSNPIYDNWDCSGPSRKCRFRPRFVVISPKNYRIFDTSVFDKPCITFHRIMKIIFSRNVHIAQDQAWINFELSGKMYCNAMLTKRPVNGAGCNRKPDLTHCQPDVLEGVCILFVCKCVCCMRYNVYHHLNHMSDRAGLRRIRMSMWVCLWMWVSSCGCMIMVSVEVSECRRSVCVCGCVSLSVSVNVSLTVFLFCVWVCVCVLYVEGVSVRVCGSWSWVKPL